MLSVEQVNKALELGALSEALHKLEQFAEARRLGQQEGKEEANEELARWASTELEGWDEADDQFPNYRRIAVQKVDRLGRAIMDAKGKPVVIEIPVLYGVKSLEGYLRKGMTTLHEEGPHGTGIRIQAQQIGVLFQAIRTEARCRLALTLPSMERPSM